MPGNAESSKRWREKNAQKVREYERERYQRRKHEKRVYIAQWYREHPDARARQNENRRARMGGTLCNATMPQRQDLWIRQEGLCGICWTGMERIEVDHKVPLCAGGTHEESNIHLVHPECNRRKGRLTLEPEV